MAESKGDYNKIQNWWDQISRSSVQRLTHSGMGREYAKEILKQILDSWGRKTHISRADYQSFLFDVQQHYVMRAPIVPSMQEFTNIINKYIIID